MSVFPNLIQQTKMNV